MPSGAELAQRLQQILIQTHEVFDHEQILQWRPWSGVFQAARSAIEQELSLSSAPKEAEGVRCVQRLGLDRTAASPTLTLASAPTTPFDASGAGPLVSINRRS